MKNLKLLFLTLFSVISLSVFSQTQVIVTNTSGPNVCDGTAMLDTSNVNLSSIYWQGVGMIINQGSYMIGNLCPGTYSVTFTTNGTPVTLVFTIQAGTFNPCLNFTGFLTTTNSVDSTTCDGTITATIANGTAPYTYSWSNGVTTQTTNSLCPGGYCCYVVDANGCSLQLCDTVGVQSPNYGDTLVFNNLGTCNSGSALDTASVSIEDCTLDYNAVDSAYLFSIVPQSGVLDSLYAIWNITDTLGITWAYPVTYYNPNGFTLFGCYNFQLVVYCLQKSMNYKTIIINSPEFIGWDGIDELGYNEKKLVRIIDLMGRNTNPVSGTLLIYQYSNGTSEKVFITE